MTVFCPHCGFAGTDAEVDNHRATGVHNDEPQAGSNLPHRPVGRPICVLHIIDPHTCTNECWAKISDCAECRPGA